MGGSESLGSVYPASLGDIVFTWVVLAAIVAAALFALGRVVRFARQAARSNSWGFLALSVLLGLCASIPMPLLIILVDWTAVSVAGAWGAILTVSVLIAIAVLAVTLSDRTRAGPLIRTAVICTALACAVRFDFMLPSMGQLLETESLGGAGSLMMLSSWSLMWLGLAAVVAMLPTGPTSSGLETDGDTHRTSASSGSAPSA